MDERELQQLFRDAPGEAPPPSFGVSDVAAASRRATARQRVRIATASSAAVLVLVGGGLFAALGPLSNEGNVGGSDSEVASVPEVDAQAPRQPQEQYGRHQDGGSAEAEALPKQGGEANDGPGAAGTERCRAVDRQLATALAGELPVGPPGDPIPGELPCTEAPKQAAYRVQDDGRSGVITVGLVKSSQEESTDKSGPPFKGSYADARTDDGLTIVVLSRADDGKYAPYRSELDEIAERIADRL